jgi:hypothetical protein
LQCGSLVFTQPLKRGVFDPVHYIYGLSLCFLNILSIGVDADILQHYLVLFGFFVSFFIGFFVNCYLNYTSCIVF